MPAVELDFFDRSRPRLEAELSDGKPARLILPRGRTLKDGDVLEGRDGERALVRAARERLVTARAGPQGDMVLLAFHLGNRHALVEIGDGFFRFHPDRALEELAVKNGFGLEEAFEPFNPVGGGFHTHG
jgi:urease accessory protein